MKNFITRATFICFMGCIGFASTGVAGPNTKISVLFQDFPKGTKCSATGTKGKVILKRKRGHPKVDIKGYADIGTLFCHLPDGRQIVTDVNKRLQPDAKTVGITLYPDGRAYLTSNTARGLISEQMSNAIQHSR